MSINLSPAKHAMLAYAINHTNGRIDWFPPNIKGAARRKVIDSLFNHALITYDGKDWFVAAEGYDALGMARPTPATDSADDEPVTTHPDPEVEAALQASEAQWVAEKKTPRTRADSKQAAVIAMLRRPEGATIPQICEATGWLQHTVRGTFAGAFKNRLGLTITSEKAAGSDRVYRLA